MLLGCAGDSTLDRPGLLVAGVGRLRRGEPGRVGSLFGGDRGIAHLPNGGGAPAGEYVVRAVHGVYEIFRRLLVFGKVEHSV